MKLSYLGATASACAVAISLGLTQPASAGSEMSGSDQAMPDRSPATHLVHHPATDGFRFGVDPSYRLQKLRIDPMNFETAAGPEDHEMVDRKMDRKTTESTDLDFLY